QGLADTAAFADAGRAEEHQQMQVAGSEGADVGFQLGVAGQADGVRRQLDGCGHRWSLSVSARDSDGMRATPELLGAAHPVRSAYWATRPSHCARRSGPGLS